MNNRKENESHPVSSVTFVATSNKGITANESKREAQSLRDTIEQSKAFKSAFNKQEPPEFSFGEPDKTATSGPSPTIIQSSESIRPVQTAQYGLVSAIMEAYNRHHNLVLRPDDVWQAILTQFSFYVNENAEDLRDCFVDFKGKKTLVVEMPGTLFSADFARFANRMVDEQIATNLKDPEVTDWLLPKFTTTRTADRVAASVTIMSTFKAYFEYVCCLMCGIPKVTLEGTPADWRLLRQKIDRLPQYAMGGEKDPVMKKWHGLLAPVLDHFVSSAEGRPDIDFWDKVCSHSGGGSGPSYLSGWVTVFACFKANGQWQGDVKPPRGYGFRRNTEWTPTWPFIDTSGIPVGAVSVPVLVDDNGTQYDTQMLAGQFAYEMTGHEKDDTVPDTVPDTVRPRTDWCIAYEGKPKAAPRNYKHGEIHPSPENKLRASGMEKAT